MTFLAPVAGLIALGLSVPVLVALYLLKLRRRTLRVSSTLLWEQSVRDLQANVPLRWLKVSLPLVLQLVALLALVAALARPAIPTLAPTSPRTVLVIDRSASMSATDGGVNERGEPMTRLERAKREALRVIDDLGRSGGGADGSRPRAMVIALGAQSRVVRTFSDDLRELKDAVNSITPTDQPASIQQVWPVVRAALIGQEETSEQSAPASVLVFSDGGFDASAAGSARAALGGGVRVRLVPSTEIGAPAVNRGIVSLGVTRDPSEPATVRVFVRVAHTAQVPAAIGVQVRDQAQTLLGGTTLRATGATSASGEPALGEAAGTIEFTRTDGGVITVSLSEGDLLPSDNAAAFVLAPMTRARVLVVGPGAESGPLAGLRGEQGADRALLAALREMDLGSVRVVSIDGYRAEVSGADAGAGRGGPSGADLVIFDRVSPERLPPVPSISIGAGVPVPEVLVEPAAAAGPEEPVPSTRIISWRRTHPILRHAPLDAVLVAPPMRMTIVEPLSAQAPPAAGPGAPAAAGPGGTREVIPLAYGTGGPLIALVQEPGVQGVKRLVLAMDLLRTNWGPDVSFPIFFASAIEHLTGRSADEAGRWTTTGVPLSVATDGRSRIVVVGPGGERFEREVAAGEQSVSLGVPERVGAYTVEGGETVCVNLLDPAETSARPGSAAADVRAASVLGAPAGSAATTAREGGVREVWPWCVLLALVLLGAEWFVYAWRMRG